MSKAAVKSSRQSADTCGEQQVTVDSGNRRLGAVLFPVRGLCLRHQPVTL